MAMLLLLSVANYSQIKNASTENIKIYGKCDICKINIEKSGNQKNAVIVNWDKNTQIALISYDPKKTNTNQILKRIALAGYDNSSFLATDATYAKLPDCCKYIREAKKVTPKSEIDTKKQDVNPETDSISSLQKVYDAYFNLKDAFVQSNNIAVSVNAKLLLEAISSVKPESLSLQEYKIWIKVNSLLTAQSNAIITVKVIGKQRESFKELSQNLYEIIKTSKPAQPVYYQYCPMKDANWLSKENAVKNPYYGAQMLNCGNTIEIIQ
ncbi:DUF3347 domain-containing protein [Flavobacterium sp. LC2016-13]|nr:DUF3347 domain-containing protein [Flavobacterium sp. LC2016-13]